MEKLKALFKVNSTQQLVLVFLVFSITGSSSIYVADPFLQIVGVTSQLSALWYWPLRVLVIFALYQVLLILFAACFGQLRYFWVIEQRFLQRFGIHLPNLRVKATSENSTSQPPT